MPPGPWEPPAEAVPHLSRVAGSVIETWHWYSDVGLAWLMRIVVELGIKSEGISGTRQFNQAWTWPWHFHLPLLSNERRKAFESAIFDPKRAGRAWRIIPRPVVSLDKGDPDRPYKVLIGAFVTGEHLLIYSTFKPDEPDVTDWAAFTIRTSMPLTELLRYRKPLAEAKPGYEAWIARLNVLCRRN